MKHFNIVLIQPHPKTYPESKLDYRSFRNFKMNSHSMKTFGMSLLLLLINISILQGNAEVRRQLRALVQLKNAKVYLRTGQVEKGLMLLNRSLVLNPGSPESWYTRGLANFRLERNEEACHDWEKACQLQVNWCLGEEYSKVGKFCFSNESDGLK